MDDMLWMISWNLTMFWFPFSSLALDDKLAREKAFVNQCLGLLLSNLQRVHGPISMKEGKLKKNHFQGKKLRLVWDKILPF